MIASTVGAGGRQSIIELLTAGSIDPEALDQVLLEGPSGIKKLHPPSQLEYSDMVHGSALLDLFEVLRENLMW